jgi:hypothetical protein
MQVEAEVTALLMVTPVVVAVDLPQQALTRQVVPQVQAVQVFLTVLRVQPLPIVAVDLVVVITAQQTQQQTQVMAVVIRLAQRVQAVAV